jgi:PAT family beta-lactamase induction signal transducer AmpG
MDVEGPARNEQQVEQQVAQGAPAKTALHPRWWTSSTYFAEGFPYSIVNSLADVLFVEHGASLQTVGLTSLFHVPWNLKFLWAPLLDEVETKRRWLIWIEVALTALLVGLAFACTLDTVLATASVLLIALAFTSATHDVAIDGFYLEALDKAGQAKFVGARVTAYRVAMLVVGGPALWLIKPLGWPGVFGVAAAIMGGLLALHALGLPRTEVPRAPIRELFARMASGRVLLTGAIVAVVVASGRALWTSAPFQAWLSGVLASAPALAKLDVAGVIATVLLAGLVVTLLALNPIERRLSASESFFAKAFADFLSQRHVRLILIFIVLFRVGESFLMKMKYPFLKSLGVTTQEYGLANGTFGVIASLIAPAVGGWLIAKHGLKVWIWPFMLAQNVLHLLFAGLAYFHDDVVGLKDVVLGTLPAWLGGFAFTAHLAIITAVIVVEMLGAGLGTAVLMVYIMRCCRPGYRAAHTALLTALMSLSFTIAGVASGVLAEKLGFTLYFGFTLLVTVPGMLLAFFVPYLDGKTASDEPAP